MRFILPFLLALLVAGDALAAPQGAGKELTAAARKSAELNEKGAHAVLDGKYQAAEEAFQKALAADPGNLTAAFNLAGMFLMLKQETRAIELLQPYAAKNPKDAGLNARLGDAYFTAKNVKQALESYEKAYALDAAYPGVAGKLATLYSLSKRLPDAERVLLAAVEKFPKDGQLLANLSSVFLATGKTDKAISTAKRGLQVNASPELYITLGNAYELQKDYKNSLIAFERAADLGDKKPELKTKIEQLKKQVG